MKIQKNKQSNKRLVSLSVIVAVLLIAGIGSGVYALSGSLFGWKPFTAQEKTTSGDNPASTEQTDNGQGIKENSLENNDGQSGSDLPLAPTTDTSGKQKVEIDIVSVNRVESVLKISSLISALDQNGSCTITVTNSANTTLYTATVGTQAMSNTSTCKGFDIPGNNIQDGNFKITIDYKSGDMYGSAIYESK